MLPWDRSDLKVPERTAQLCDRTRHQHSKNARERSDPKSVLLVGQRLLELRLRELQPFPDRLGVRKQKLADRGQCEAGPPAHDQALAKLGLQCLDLLRDGRLREREGSGGTRERPLLRDLSKDDQPPRIEHR